MTGLDDQKRAAARHAVATYVESGMVVGLGSGTTAAFVVSRIGELLLSGELRGVLGVPTSAATAALAARAGVPLGTLAEARPHLTVDGADEISPSLALIKGHGGALLREKIVAAASRDGLVVVADASKEVEGLGRGPVPVEVDTFGYEATMDALADLGCRPALRMNGEGTPRPFVTDGGHYTVDCDFASIADPGALGDEIRNIPGALECGLFVDMARAAVIAGEGGPRTVEP